MLFPLVPLKWLAAQSTRAGSKWTRGIILRSRGMVFPTGSGSVPVPG
jgi:hypothetical protein